MLLYAEAANRAEGSPNPLAYQTLNAIRARAELPALEGLSQEAFEKAVWAERYYELAYES